MSVNYELKIADKILSVEIGKLAKKANGSATLRYGDSVILVTATMADARLGLDFFPLTMSTVFQYFPLSMLSTACRSIIFINTFDMINTVTPIVITILLIVFNSFLLKQKMKQ